MSKSKHPKEYKSYQKYEPEFIFTIKGRSMDVKCAKLTMMFGRDSSEFKIFKKKFDRCSKEWANKKG